MPIRVLLEDSDRELQPILHDFLLDAGFEPESSSSMSDCVVRFERSLPDIVVVESPNRARDQEPFSQLWSQATASNVPVVVIDDGMSVASPLGPAGRVVKPFRLSHLIDVIHAALELSPNGLKEGSRGERSAAPDGRVLIVE